MKRCERLTKDALLGIKPGQMQIFAFETAKAIKSARAYIVECSRLCLPDGVERWETKADWDNNILVINAVAR